MNTYIFASKFLSSEEGLMAALTKRYSVPGISMIGPSRVPRMNKAIPKQQPASQPYFLIRMSGPMAKAENIPPNNRPGSQKKASTLIP